MNKTPEIDTLKKICKEAKSSGLVTGVQLTQLSVVFGSRFTKAWEAINDGRIKKYVFEPSGRIAWVVIGKEREYLVMPAADFCSCDDFYFRVMDREVHLCYHLIGQKLAEALMWYDLINERDELYTSLMEEWRKVTS